MCRHHTYNGHCQAPASDSHSDSHQRVPSTSDTVSPVLLLPPSSLIPGPGQAAWKLLWRVNGWRKAASFPPLHSPWLEWAPQKLPCCSPGPLSATEIGWVPSSALVLKVAEPCPLPPTTCPLDPLRCTLDKVFIYFFIIAWPPADPQ